MADELDPSGPVWIGKPRDLLVGEAVIFHELSPEENPDDRWDVVAVDGDAVTVQIIGKPQCGMKTVDRYEIFPEKE